MKIVYLAAGIGQLKYKDVVYQDKFVERDISGDMLEINLDPYDIIVATPPCNYYSRARGNRLSKYAEATKHLLPDILNILTLAEKPFIVENVINRKRMSDIIVKYKNIYHEVGRHCYFTNILCNLENIKQDFDFKYGGYLLVGRKNLQGGFHVQEILEKIIDTYIKRVGVTE